MATRFLAALIAASVFIGSSCTTDPRTKAKRLTTVADRYHREGKVREASLLYRRAIQTYPKLGEAHYGLGMVGLAQKDEKNAVPALYRAYELQTAGYDAYQPLATLFLSYVRTNPIVGKRARKALEELNGEEERRHPGSALLARIRGELALMDKQPREAIKLLTVARQRDPKDRESVVPLFRALYADGQAAEAEKLARETIAAHKDFLDIYDHLCGLLETQKRWSDIEKIRREEIAALPARGEPRFRLATHYASRGQSKEAMSVLQEILDKPKQFPGGHFFVGSFYLRWIGPERAIKLFQEGMKLDPRREEQYREKIVEALLQQGKFQESQQLIDDLLKTFPKSPHALAIHGASLLARQPQTGIAELRSAVRAAPENGIFRLALGDAERNFGSPRNAELELKEAVRLLPANSMAKLSLGALYLEINNSAAAFDLAQSVFAVEPFNVGAGQIRAQVWTVMKLYRQAREELTRILKIAPDNRETRLLAARLAIAEGKRGDAETALRQLHQSNRADPAPLRELLEMYAANKRFQEARDLLSSELRVQPESPGLHRMLSEVALRSGDYATAAEHAEFLVRKEPALADSWAALGRVQYHGRRSRAAEESLRKCLAIDKDHLGGNMHLGTLLAETGRLKESIPYLGKAIERAPNEAGALNNLAFALAETGGDLARAVSLAERAVAMAPGDVAILDTLGWVYLKRKLYPEAISVFRRAVDREPSNPSWRYHLGLALFKYGKRGDARNELQAALRHKPSAGEKSEIEALLR